MPQALEFCVYLLDLRKDDTPMVSQIQRNIRNNNHAYLFLLQVKLSDKTPFLEIYLKSVISLALIFKRLGNSDNYQTHSMPKQG
jgi:hypothetical protein